MAKNSNEFSKKIDIFVILKIVLIFGMLVSLFLVYEHFSATASEYCKFGASFDCGIVNKGPYSTLDGISYLLTIHFNLPLPLIDIASKGFIPNLLTSNAFLGFLTLLILFLMVSAKTSKKNFLWIKNNKITKWIKGILIFGIIYGLYLVLIQHFVIKTYCIFCLLLDIVIISSLVLVWRSQK